MKPTNLAAALLLGVLLAATGCESREDNPPKPASPSAPTTPPPTPTAGTASPTAAGTSSAAPSSAGPAPTTAPSATTAPASAAEAQAKLDQVMQYIKDNKLDLADTTLKQLENNKASLPVSVADKLPNARQMINAAKAGGATGIKLPGS